jgi:hypothetical protein
MDIGLFDKPIVESEFEMAIQELDVLFNTQNTELIGNPKYGINFLQFLWTIQPDCDALRNYINEKIQMYTLYLRNTRFTINVSTADDSYEAVYVINVILYRNNKDNNPVNKQYIITK